MSESLPFPAIFRNRISGPTNVTGLNLYSLMVAVVGAIVVLLVYHAIRRAV